MRILITISFFHFFILSLGQSTPKNMVYIESGTYVPLYSLDSGIVKVKSFYIDKYLVTNEDYENYLLQYPAWSKQNVKAIFADKNYLKYWKFNNKLGDNPNYQKNSPVVNVSWFAAKKYCECQGKRLATVNEWEFVALANGTKKNASKDDGYYQKILDAYSKPTPKVLPATGKGFKNIYGVYDMHGLVWEWTLDFISALASKDSRDGGTLDKNEFCGAGAVGTKTPSNYAAFMRYAMRSSLKANYSINNIGFRCVKEIKK